MKKLFYYHQPPSLTSSIPLECWFFRSFPFFWLMKQIFSYKTGSKKNLSTKKMKKIRKIFVLEISKYSSSSVLHHQVFHNIFIEHDRASLKREFSKSSRTWNEMRRAFIPTKKPTKKDEKKVRAILFSVFFQLCTLAKRII